MQWAAVVALVARRRINSMIEARLSPTCTRQPQTFRSPRCYDSRRINSMSKTCLSPTCAQQPQTFRSHVINLVDMHHTGAGCSEGHRYFCRRALEASMLMPNIVRRTSRRCVWWLIEHRLTPLVLPATALRQNFSFFDRFFC